MTDDEINENTGLRRAKAYLEGYGNKVSNEDVARAVQVDWVAKPLEERKDLYYVEQASHGSIYAYLGTDEELLTLATSQVRNDPRVDHDVRSGPLHLTVQIHSVRTEDGIYPLLRTIERNI
jgi:hypothetical protein